MSYLADYQLFWNSDLYEVSSGVSIYVRFYRSATIDTSLTCGGFHESLWLYISLTKRDSLLLGCIYRSPSSSTSNHDNLIALSNNAGENMASHKVALGDFTWKRTL